MLEHCGGAGAKEMVASYAASAALLEQPAAGCAAPAPPAGQGQGGVDWSTLKGSPAAAMEQTLRWLEAEHGGTDSYLATIGCERGGAWWGLGGDG